MTTFKWFLVASVGLAAVSFAAPLALSYTDQDLALRSLFFAGWSAIACIALFVTGLFRFRWRGLWLAIPTIIALIWPIYVPVMFAKSIDECRKLHHHWDCLP